MGMDLLASVSDKRCSGLENVSEAVPESVKCGNKGAT